VTSAGNGVHGPLALRDAAGKIYAVDRIIKYSGREDYAVFSVLAAPVVEPLETRSRPPLNTPVFAIGNALGEGVVTRDGLYTSDTPEELDGRWQWLRFSAAASPGNSGGPLVDRNGKVVGVVVRKSPNENLNAALAIGQVLDGSEEAGVIEARSSYASWS
jgi:S1-C subfamily serine protease